MSLSSKTAFLSYLARLNPKLWEIIHPHVPKVSIGTRDVMAAMVIKAMVPEITDVKMAKELQAMGKRADLLRKIGRRKHQALQLGQNLLMNWNSGKRGRKSMLII